MIHSLRSYANPILAPISSLLYSSLRDDVYCITWIVPPHTTMSAWCDYFHHLLTAIGMTNTIISSPKGGWSQYNIFSSKKRIAEKRDEQPHVIIITLWLDECEAIDMLAMWVDMIIFDPWYTAIQSNSDYARGIGKAMNHFLSLERKQKICIYPKESHALHELITEWWVDLALSYSSAIMASFRLETKNQAGQYSVTIMGQPISFSLPKSIPSNLLPAYTAACASLYALIQEKHAMIEVMQTYHIMDCLHLETLTKGSQQWFFGARETLNSVWWSHTNRVIVSPHAHTMTNHTTITYRDLTTKKMIDIISNKQRWQTYFPFFTQIQALRFAQAVFSSSLCLCESTTPQETKDAVAIIWHS